MKFSSSSLSRLEKHLCHSFQKNSISSAAYAVVCRGEIVLSAGHGYTGLKQSEPVTPDTLFAIGSLTKSMTATAILQLQEQKQLDLDAPVTRYLPWFTMATPKHAMHVTLRHLLNQTSGLGNGAWRVALDDPSLCDSLEQTVRALAKVKAIDSPGHTWAYSNAGYSVAGMVIEVASNMTYAQYLKQNLFAPANMLHSTLNIEEVKNKPTLDRFKKNSVESSRSRFEWIRPLPQLDLLYTRQPTIWRSI